MPWAVYWVIRTEQLATDGATVRPAAALTIPALGALLIGALALLAGPDAPATLTGRLRMALDGIVVLRLAGVAQPFPIVGGLTALGGIFVGYAARLPVPAVVAGSGTR